MTKIFNYRNYAVALTVATVALVSGCTKEEEGKSLAELSTSPVTYIDVQSVMVSGNVTTDGGSPVTEKGIAYGTQLNPTTSDGKISGGSGMGNFTCTLAGLNASTPYYARAYAVNEGGTAYGPVISFRTWNAETVTDIEGNVYHTLTIGGQVWLVENLNVTHYRNGEPIPWIPDSPEWEGLTTGAYCDYEDDPANADTYGRLYNWFAVNDDRDIAPEGWHVSSDAEWTAITDELGGEGTTGGKLKEAGLTHWLEPNSGATNETGFSALPGGHREYGGGYTYMNWGGGWWTSTAGNENDAWVRYLDFGNYDVWRYLEDKRYGRSVRCVKN